MRVVIRHNNETVAKTDFPVMPTVGAWVRLRNNSEYIIDKVTFVESGDMSEIDYIGHIEIEVK